MKVTGLDHIGIATKSLEERLSSYSRAFGLKRSDIHELAGNLRAAFVTVGDTKLEFLEQSGEGTIAKFLETRGEGLHHIAFAVTDIEQALKDAEQAGIRLIDKTPREGAGGKRIAFLHPKSTGGVLIELVE